MHLLEILPMAKFNYDNALYNQNLSNSIMWARGSNIDENYQKLMSWVTCKDYIIDTFFNNDNNYYVDVHRNASKNQLDNPCVVIVCSRKMQDIKDNLTAMNAWEEEHGLPLTKWVMDKPVNTNENFYTWITWDNKVWNKINCTLSYYLSILRVFFVVGSLEELNQAKTITWGTELKLSNRVYCNEFNYIWQCLYYDNAINNSTRKGQKSPFSLEFVEWCLANPKIIIEAGAKYPHYSGNINNANYGHGSTGVFSALNRIRSYFSKYPPYTIPKTNFWEKLYVVFRKEHLKKLVEAKRLEKERKAKELAEKKEALRKAKQEKAEAALVKKVKQNIAKKKGTTKDAVPILQQPVKRPRVKKTTLL